MQGIRHTFGTKQKQARPMVKDDLLEAMVMIDRQKPIKAAREPHNRVVNSSSCATLACTLLFFEQLLVRWSSWCTDQ